MSIIDGERLEKMDAYWRAANYLTVGQIYLQDNPLLREPLRPEHIKPRLLGHWGTSPGQNLVYLHLNRLIEDEAARVMYLSGPGHGGPAVLANVYLEGTYSEVYPEVTQDAEGMRLLFRRFSTPGGVPSHVSVTTPGSIHEGGELGYVLTHAFGAVFDNPRLLAVAVIGDGEAETGPLEGSWKGIKYLNPARDGAVLPVLHLNGYKISGPTELGRAADDDIASLLAGHGYSVHVVEGDEPRNVHRLLWRTLDLCYEQIRDIQHGARTRGLANGTPRWPAIVLRTPKGWTGPKEVDGLRVEGTFRAHQVPIANPRTDPRHLAMLEAWMQSYQPAELFDELGRLQTRFAALAPAKDLRMGASSYANGGLRRVGLKIPELRDYALPVLTPATERHESTRVLGQLMRDIFIANKEQANFRLFCPDETNSNRLNAVFETENRCFSGRTAPDDDHVSPDGRVMEVLSEHNCHGWLEGYILTGRHGLFATYEAFSMISASMTVQHFKWLEEAAKLSWREPVSSLNILLTSTCWRNDHNGFSHQGPGLIDVVLSKKGYVSRVYLPPDANCLLSVADHCFRSQNYVNLIVIDKQPQLQWLDIEAAIEHCARGASIWEWACNEGDDEAEVVLASAGDIPTMEVVAAAWWLRKKAPQLSVRVVNVVDLMTLFPPDVHPHGMPDEAFVELFTRSHPVVFAFHGYQRAIHEIIHGRPDTERFHVRGYNEEGTTTTPFDMVVRNKISRYHLAAEALRRSRPMPSTPALLDECAKMLERHEQYVTAHLEDMPEVRDWTWSDDSSSPAGRPADRAGRGAAMGGHA